MKIDAQCPNVTPIGRIDVKRVDATTEADIANHQEEDDATAIRDSAKFSLRVRDDDPLDRMAENARELDWITDGRACPLHGAAG